MWWGTVVVKREMTKAEAMIRLIEWIQTELIDETTWYCGSEEEWDLLTDLHVIDIMHISSKVVKQEH